MSESQPLIPRLCLVASADAGPAFTDLLQAALAGGDVASLIVTSAAADPAALERFAALVTPIAQQAGAAVLVHGDTRIVGRVHADGVHVDEKLAELRETVRRLRPKLIVGAGGATSRHEAMDLGEADPDYILFGRLDSDMAPMAHGQARDLADWWAPLFQIPAILMGGSSLDSVADAAATGVEFVALRRAVWEHPEGPAAAVAAANRLLARQNSPAPESMPAPEDLPA